MPVRKSTTRYSKLGKSLILQTAWKHIQCDNTRHRCQGARGYSQVDRSGDRVSVSLDEKLVSGLMVAVC